MASGWMGGTSLPMPACGALTPDGECTEEEEASLLQFRALAEPSDEELLQEDEDDPTEVAQSQPPHHTSQ
eukprot:CAMPEP_0171089830 /NCGR_PEP_ID=MMETSP0766_2-20121228/27361_1 /TAXON_ID=439317 /ORGANISM="Gambierdiscus australes, Strain CAWD 149" /LENGTH=69 /DNA_ID=CAMNT_0011547743 /DNA_START=115 /DNA_END=324 /DNA_ORIENTATION=+